MITVRHRFTLFAIVVTCICIVPALAQKKFNPGIAKLSTLVGEWESTWENSPNGEKGPLLSYELRSDGTTIMERLLPVGEPEMVSMYAADGNRVFLTHYCSANNQPRMRTTAVSADPKELEFWFQDATNLSSPAAGHIHHVKIVFKDRDHFTQFWTWREKGKDVTAVYHFTRKK